jgi:hypothetical protein
MCGEICKQGVRQENDSAFSDAIATDGDMVCARRQSSEERIRWRIADWAPPAARREDGIESPRLRRSPRESK